MADAIDRELADIHTRVAACMTPLAKLPELWKKYEQRRGWADPLFCGRPFGHNGECNRLDHRAHRMDAGPLPQDHPYYSGSQR